MIAFFSATGNSRWAAARLAADTRERLVNITEALTGDCVYTLEPNERLGFVFPVHGWRVPTIVRTFLRKMVIRQTTTTDNPAEQPYCFALITAGDDVGRTIEDYLNPILAANESLQQLGISHVDSAWSLVMPESYVGLPFMDVDTKEKEREKISRSDQRLRVIGEEVFDRKKDVFRLDYGHWPWINSHILGAIFEHQLITDKPFRVDADRCVRCGICAQVCPTHDIIGGHGLQPEWKHDGSCLTCFNCFHHCPHHAIEYGHRTRHKGQYFFK
ncbi:MAG: EFR1 family ferrodoxin [Prevotellaceae bacterium]|nr:EFR1 family ferrodoxin [Prevotellaceae bacterium]